MKLTIFSFFFFFFASKTLVDSASFLGHDQERQSLLTTNDALQKLLPMIRYGHGGDDSLDDTEQQQEHPINYSKLLKTIIPSYLQDFVRLNLKAMTVCEKLNSWNVSDSCQGHICEWVYQANQILDGQYPVWSTNATWVLHMIDAWGKLPEGVLSGHVNALGDYDECVGLRANNVVDHTNSHPGLPREFRGRYCNVAFSPKPVQPTTKTKVPPAQSRTSVSIGELLALMSIGEGVIIYPSIATCFPSTCSPDDVKIMLTSFFDELENANATFNFTQVLYPNILSCYTDEKPDFKAADYSVMALMGLIAGLIVLGTILDIAMSRSSAQKNDKELEKPKRQPGIGAKALLAFSLKTNVTKLLNTKTGPGDFRCLHGMRFLSTMWVVTAHTWYVTTFLPVWNMADLKTTHEDWTILTMINSHVSVDTFFVLSGLLVTFNVLKMMDKTKGSLNLPMFYIHRYLRLTPQYAILIGLMATLWPYVSQGPYWIIMDRWSQFCKDNWWTNLLYVNNLVNAKKMCYGEAWYLANDMQFYIVSPLLLIPLWKFPLIGKIFMGIVTILSVISPGLLVYYKDTTPGTIGTRNTVDWFYSVNIMPYARAQTYMVGMWMGYILHKTKGAKLRIPIIVSVLGWLFFLGTLYATLYSIYPYFDPHTDIPDVPSFLYASLNKFAWGIGVCWVIFACIHGYGGVVNSFLSWRIFVPLGRLTFAIYLISLHLQMILHLSFRQAITYNKYTMTNFAFAHVVMAVLLGFLCTIAFEAPFIHLERLLFPVGGGSQTRIKRPAKRYGIFYNSNEVIMNSFDVKDETESSNNVSSKKTDEKAEV